MMLTCPACGARGDDDEPGDLKMCAECGVFSRVEYGALRRLTHEEQRNVAAAFGEFLRNKRH